MGVKQLKFCSYDEDEGILFHQNAPLSNTPNVSIAEYVLGKLERNPDFEYLVEGETGKTFNGSQIIDHVHRLAYGLHQLGLKEGDIVTFYINNSGMHTFLQLALLAIGVTCSAIYHSHPLRELAYQVNDTESKYIIAFGENLETAIKCMAQCPSVKGIIFEGEEVPTEVDIKIPFFKADDWLKRDPQPEDPKFPIKMKTPLDQAVGHIQYSSGSTGQPKGVLKTHFNTVSYLSSASTLLKVDGKTFINFNPIAHGSGTWFFLSGYSEKSRSILYNGFDLETWCQVVEKYKIQWSFMAPTHLAVASKSSIPDKYDLSSLELVTTGGSVVPKAGIDLFMEKFKGSKMQLIQGYGSTEGGSILGVPPGGSNESSGIICEHVKLKIMDPETKTPCGPNKEGELWINSEQLAIGYWKNPTADAENFIIDSKGLRWWMSGDAGYFNDLGEIVITGRYKELIKVGIAQVPPAELEAIIVSHPSVKEVCVLGIPDEEMGQIPKAYIVMKEGQSVSKEELMEFTNQQVGEWKKIRDVQFLDSIPRVGWGGKMSRPDLKKQLGLS